MEKIVVENFIDGEFRKSSSYLDSFDPSTGKVWAQIPETDVAQADEAVNAAKKAFPAWSNLPVAERCRLLNKVADLVEERLDELAKAESRDQGKPIWLARTVDIPRVITNFRHFATAAQSVTDTAIVEPECGVLNYTVHQPVGVAVLIVPWNLPLYLLSFKLAPALAYGNTVVAKPSEFTSVTAWMLCQIMKEAGFPLGVVNVVFGSGPSVGERLVTHPETQLISFTGGTKTGLHIAQLASAMNKKISLEMGGKNPAIVFSDADLEKCIPTLIRSSFINQGEVCLCTSRIFVQRQIYKAFLEKFVEETKKLKVGPPTSPDAFMGPLVSKAHWEKVTGYLEIAKQEGAIIHAAMPLQLPQENLQGYFVSPVVLTDLPDDSRCMQEEIFGPVTCIVPFDDEAEVVHRANAVQYGLCASLWSRNVNSIHRVAQKLNVGTVWCNCWLVRNLHMPFGGMKMSGMGRESTLDSREFFTEKKTICVKTG